LVYFRFFQSKDKVIFICQAQKDYLRKHYRFNPKDWTVIYNGINTNYFSGCFREGNNVRAVMREKFGLSQQEKVIVKVARMFREKGHFYAIDAMKHLHENLQFPAHLFFVGSGDDSYEA